MHSAIGTAAHASASPGDEVIDGSRSEAWLAAAQAARELKDRAGCDHPDLERLEGIAARIEIGALVLASVEMRRTHHELKADIFELSMAEHRRNDRLFAALERVVGAIDRVEGRLERLESRMSSLVLRLNMDQP